MLMRPRGGKYVRFIAPGGRDIMHTALKKRFLYTVHQIVWILLACFYVGSSPSKSRSW